jgi:hypothetical protein
LRSNSGQETKRVAEKNSKLNGHLYPLFLDKKPGHSQKVSRRRADNKFDNPE